MSFPRQTNADDDSYKPISFTQYVWERCKSQPLIPIGTSSFTRSAVCSLSASLASRGTCSARCSCAKQLGPYGGTGTYAGIEGCMGSC
jgi:hypothetical protein